MGVRSRSLIRHFSRRGSSTPAVLTHLRGRGRLSLSVLVYVCVSEWKSALVLVRSFSISFGLSALFVFNCSILFLPLSTPSAHSLDLLLLLLLPFPRPIRHHWQFEALRGADAAADAPEDAADAPEDAQESRRIHEVFRHWHYKVYVDGGKSSALCKMKYGSLLGRDFVRRKFCYKI